jgi:hypothetical protein
MVEMRNAYKLLVGNHGGRRPLGRYRRNGRFILRNRMCEWIGFKWLRMGTNGGLL